MSRRSSVGPFLSRVVILVVAGLALGHPGGAAAELLDWRVFSNPAPAFNDLFGAELKKIVVDRLTGAGLMQDEADYFASLSGARRAEAITELVNAKVALAQRTAITPVALHTTLPWAYWLDQAAHGDREINALMIPERDGLSGRAVFLAMPEPNQTQIDLPYGAGKVLISILGAADPTPAAPPGKPPAVKAPDKTSGGKGAGKPADRAAAEQPLAGPTLQDHRAAVALVLDADGVVRDVVRFTAPYAAAGPSVAPFAAVDGRVLLYRVRATAGEKTTTTAIQVALPAPP